MVDPQQRFWHSRRCEHLAERHRRRCRNLRQSPQRLRGVVRQAPYRRPCRLGRADDLDEGRWVSCVASRHRRGAGARQQPLGLCPWTAGHREQRRLEPELHRLRVDASPACGFCGTAPAPDAGTPGRRDAGTRPRLPVPLRRWKRCLAGRRPMTPHAHAPHDQAPFEGMHVRRVSVDIDALVGTCWRMTVVTAWPTAWSWTAPSAWAAWCCWTWRRHWRCTSRPAHEARGRGLVPARADGTRHDPHHRETLRPHRAGQPLAAERTRRASLDRHGPGCV